MCARPFIRRPCSLTHHWDIVDMKKRVTAAAVTLRTAVIDVSVETILVGEPRLSTRKSSIQGPCVVDRIRQSVNRGAMVSAVKPCT